MEVAMRMFVVVFVAALTLGLVGFGVIVKQKATDPVPLTAAGARVSSSQNTVAVAKTDKAPLQSQATNAAAPFAPATGAQNSTMAVARAFSAPTPKPVAACNNPDACVRNRALQAI